MKNQPYVKEYDENGLIENPVNKRNAYSSPYPNREQRRSMLNQPRFRGNGNQLPLTVSGTVKYLRRLQLETKKDGTLKFIHHYVERRNIC